MYPSSSPSRSSFLLSSPFLSSYPLCLSPSSLSLPSRRRLLLSARAASSPQPQPDVFGRKVELTGIQVLVDSLAPPVRLAASAVILAGAVAAGYGLGFKFGGSKNLALGGAAVAGVAGGVAVSSLNSQVPEVAAAALHNFAAGIDDPKDFKKEDVENIVKKYGISKQDAAFKAELSGIYRRFVSSVLPPGAEDLTGNEVELILKFKNSLGIDDPDAAAMHMEIGRWIFRQRLETGDRDGAVGQRRAFQKLIYVSTLVFAEASPFLLPWKRVFKITDAQVEIAVRDNAERLFASKLKSVGIEIGAEQLVSLRQSQLLYKLSDELAEDLFRQHIRKLVDHQISSAAKMLKLGSRAGNGFKMVVKALDKVVVFNNQLLSLKSNANAASFALGVGPVSLAGGEYADERKMNDLKLLYTAYASDSISGGLLDENKLVSLNQLRDIFGLGRQEAEKIMLDFTTKVYRKRLAQSILDSDLDSADGKAVLSQNLCEELHFDPEHATKVHEELYRKKLQQCVSDGELNEDDVAALNRLRIFLCIPQQTIDAAHSDICGSLFEKVVSDVIASGTKGYDELQREEVRKAARSLRLTREAVMLTVGKAARKIFIMYVKRAQTAGKQSKLLRELDQMVAFNTKVVTQLLADIKGVYSDEPSEEPSKALDEEDKEWDNEWKSLRTLKRLRDSLKNSQLRLHFQTEINLKDELSLEDRMALYKSYLIYCLTGVRKRMGGGFVIDHGEGGIPQYNSLYQLGRILGLTAKEYVQVHRKFAEGLFTAIAAKSLADGELTKAKFKRLTARQVRLGLPPDSVVKLVAKARSTKIAAGLETSMSRGELSLKQIRELKGADVNLESMVSKRIREELFKKTVDEIFSSGSGEFDEEEIYQKIPSELSIDAEEAKGVAIELARQRISNSLVQSVSMLRQRKYQGVVSTLNNLLACDKAAPSEPLTWDSSREVMDLYEHYLKSGPAPEKLSRLQYLLGISDAAAAAIREENFVS